MDRTRTAHRTSHRTTQERNQTKATEERTKRNQKPESHMDSEEQQQKKGRDRPRVRVYLAREKCFSFGINSLTGALIDLCLFGKRKTRINFFAFIYIARQCLSFLCKSEWKIIKMNIIIEPEPKGTTGDQRRGKERRKVETKRTQNQLSISKWSIWCCLVGSMTPSSSSAHTKWQRTAHIFAETHTAQMINI